MIHLLLSLLVVTEPSRGANPGSAVEGDESGGGKDPTGQHPEGPQRKAHQRPERQTIVGTSQEFPSGLKNMGSTGSDLRRVRTFKSLDEVTLVAMTAFHTEEVAAMAKKSGAVACLAKPFDANSVLSLIRESKTVETAPKGRAARRAVAR